MRLPRLSLGYRAGIIFSTFIFSGALYGGGFLEMGWSLMRRAPVVLNTWRGAVNTPYHPILGTIPTRQFTSSVRDLPPEVLQVPLTFEQRRFQSQKKLASLWNEVPFSEQAFNRFKIEIAYSDIKPLSLLGSMLTLPSWAAAAKY